MKNRTGKNVIRFFITMGLGFQSILSIQAAQVISKDPEDSQENEISEIGNLVKQIRMEASKDGTLADEDHQILKMIDLTMLENQEEANQDQFVLPIRSNYTISAGTWHYGTSFYEGFHLGVDFALPISTVVHAVSDGVVVAAANACPTDGYLGSNCGNPGTEGGGNQIYLLTKVKGTCYIIKYLHLKQDSLISVGAVVKQNDKIGEIGSSGNSSGPHLHIEMIRLEEKHLWEFLKDWDGDLSFHIGFGQIGYENRCEVKSDSPCREKPEILLGLNQ